VAVNCCVAPTGIEAFPGVTAIDTSAGAVTVSVVLPVSLLSWTDVAVTVTVFGLGTALGAV
jgi:hypothetical protein